MSQSRVRQSRDLEGLLQRKRFDKRGALFVFHLVVQGSSVQVTQMPHRKRNENLTKFKSDLARGLKSLREAQQHIQTIRTNGASDAEIRKVMMALGFGMVSPNQFLKAKSLEDVLLLLDLARPDSN